MKTSKITFKENSRSRTLDDGRSLGNTHHSFNQTSSYIGQRDGSLKRRRQKLNYKDIYLEKQDYKMNTVRCNSMKTFDQSIDCNYATGLVSSAPMQQYLMNQLKRSNEERMSKHQDDYANANANSTTHKGKGLHKSQSKTDVLSIKTKQEREYKRRKELERSEDDNIYSNQYDSFPKGYIIRRDKDKNRTAGGEGYNDDSSKKEIKLLMESRLGSSTKKVSTKYQEKLQYNNFNDFLNKNDSCSGSGSNSYANRKINNKEEEKKQNAIDIDNSLDGNNKYTYQYEESKGKKYIQNINVIPNSIDNDYFNHINQNKKMSNTGNDEVSLKTNSKMSLNTHKGINEMQKTNQLAQSQCSNAKKTNTNANTNTNLNQNRRKANKVIQSQMSTGQSGRTSQGLRQSKESFNNKWQRAIDTNSIVRTNSKDFFSYVYKAKAQLGPGFDCNLSPRRTSPSPLNNIQQENKSQLGSSKRVKESNIQCKANENNEENEDYNRQSKGMANQHGILRQSMLNSKKSQSKDEMDDIQLINMMKTSNIHPNNDYMELNDNNNDKEANPSSSIKLRSNYAKFVSKKPNGTNKTYRPASSLTMQKLKDNSMDFNDKGAGINDFNTFKTNIKVGNKNLSTIQKEKEANEDSYYINQQEKKYNRKPQDILMETIKNNNNNYAIGNDCHYSNTKLKKNIIPGESILKNVNKLNGIHNRDIIEPSNTILKSTTLSPMKREQMLKNSNQINLLRNSNHDLDSISKYNSAYKNKPSISNSPINWEYKGTPIASRKNYHLDKLQHSQRCNRDTIPLYQQIEHHSNDFNTNELLLSKGFQTFPINPYYNNNSNLNRLSASSSNIFNAPLGKVVSLARSLSQGSILSITDQFIINHHISLSPNSTLRKDLVKNTLTRQNSTFHIDKLKKDLQDYHSSREKSLKKQMRNQKEFTELQSKRMMIPKGGIMPPNEINEIEYFFV